MSDSIDDIPFRLSLKKRLQIQIQLQISPNLTTLNSNKKCIQTTTIMASILYVYMYVYKCIKYCRPGGQTLKGGHIYLQRTNVCIGYYTVRE